MYRLLFILLIFVIFLGWSSMVASNNPIYAELRWPVAIFSAIIFLIFNVRSSLTGFKGGGKK